MRDLWNKMQKMSIKCVHVALHVNFEQYLARLRSLSNGDHQKIERVARMNNCTSIFLYRLSRQNPTTLSQVRREKTGRENGQRAKDGEKKERNKERERERERENFSFFPLKPYIFEVISIYHFNISFQYIISINHFNVTERDPTGKGWGFKVGVK